MEIKHKMTTEAVKIVKVVEMVSPPQAEHLHQKSLKMTLILRKVEIVKVVEMLFYFLGIAQIATVLLYQTIKYMLHST